MTQGQVMAVFQQAVLTAMKMAAPLLIVSIVIGLIVAVFQAATQIHEQTLTFVPKVFAIALLLLAMGPWMMTILDDLVKNLFAIIPTL